MARLPLNGKDIISDGPTEAEMDMMEKKAYGRALERRKAGDYTPVRELIKEEIDENRSKWLMEIRKGEGKTRQRGKMNTAEQDSRTSEKVLGIIDGLKKKRPTLADLDEWEETEPPFPTYGGMALEEDLKKRRKAGKASPYLA